MATMATVAKGSALGCGGLGGGIGSGAGEGGGWLGGCRGGLGGSGGGEGGGGGGGGASAPLVVCPPPLGAMTGWPSLSLSLPFTMQLSKAGLQLECLGVTARGESWLLQLAGRHARTPGTLTLNPAPTLPPTPTPAPTPTLTPTLTRHALGPLEPLVQRTVIKGESVWVGWPHCREARVVCASCAAGRQWRDRRGAAASCDMHPAEWRQLCEEVHVT